MTDTASIVKALAHYKARGVPFSTAWASVVGQVPREAGGQQAESVERSTFVFLRDAYCDSPESRTRLAPDLAAEVDCTTAGRGRSHATREAV